MGCYRNRFPGSYIYSPAQRVPVYWGHYSIVEAELICLSDLMDNGRNWSYAVNINMAGSEAMMFTNRELVANISANMGRLYTESFPLPEGNSSGSSTSTSMTPPTGARGWGTMTRLHLISQFTRVPSPGD